MLALQFKIKEDQHDRYVRVLYLAEPMKMRENVQYTVISFDGLGALEIVPFIVCLRLTRRTQSVTAPMPCALSCTTLLSAYSYATAKTTLENG